MVLLEAFAINSVVLAIKIIIIGPITGFYRMREHLYSTTEDRARYKDFEPLVRLEDSKTERFRRIHQNDVENVLPFVIISTAFLAVSWRDLWHPGTRIWHEITGAVILSLYTLSRIIYLICYAFSLQPWRTLIYFAGNFVQIGLGIYTIVMAFVPWQ